MPKQKRWQTKRTLNFAYDNITRAMVQVSEIIELFEGHSSGYDTDLQQALKILDIARPIIKNVSEAI